MKCVHVGMSLTDVCIFARHWGMFESVAMSHVDVWWSPCALVKARPYPSVGTADALLGS